MIASKLRGAIEALREELQQRHGATHLDVDVHIDFATRRVVLDGEVLVHRLAAMLEARVLAEVGAGWSVDGSALRVWSGGPWRALPERVELHASRGTDVPCTVLLPEDGPVQELLVRDDALLVRGTDGTVGWIEGVQGGPVAPPELPEPADAPASAVAEVASAYLGVPYRLGGTDEDAIDCSGLVQRVLRRSHAIVVPRHSTDQRAIDPRVGPPPSGAGHLVFVWTAGEALCHVGLASESTVIHASRSRSRVVEDPRDAFVAAATRVEHVTFDALLSFARRVAGRPSLVAAGFVLGMPDTEPCGSA